MTDNINTSTSLEPQGARPISNPEVPIQLQKIGVRFIRVLGKSKNGDISITSRSIMSRDITATPFSVGDQSGYFRTQHRMTY